MNSENCFKKIYLLIFALVIMVASAKAAPTAYAEFSVHTLTFKYGEMPSSGYVFDVTDTGRSPGWWNLGGTIYMIEFDPSFAQARPASCMSWFSNMELYSIIGIEYFNTSNVTDMDYMFSGVTMYDNSKSIDFRYFDTSNVKHMNHMFEDCGLKSLDLSSFNTSNVVGMAGMFSGCRELTSLDISSFNTSNVRNMEGMFYFCDNLKSLDISSFNTSNVWNMKSMFEECRVNSLNLSNFNTSNVRNMSCMFKGCKGLESLDLSGFNTSSVRSTASMFYGCGFLTSIDVSSFNTANDTIMYGMFYGCERLKSLDLTNFNTSKVTSMSDMFWDCEWLETIYCNDTWDCSNSSDMFHNCPRLKGAISYDVFKQGSKYANPETGYFTKKAYNLVLGGYAVSTKGEQYKAGVVEGTVTFDPSTFTLYMKDATITGNSTYGIYSKLPELNIVVEGNCTVTSTSSTALSSARGNLTFRGDGTLTLQGITGLTAVTDNPAEGNKINVYDRVTLIVEGTGGNGIVGGTSSGTYYTTLSITNRNAVLKVKGANYDLFRIKDVDFLDGQHVALPIDAYFSTANHTIMSNGSALKNTWAELSTKKYVNKITITDYTWPSDFEAADYEASTSTTGCKVTNIVYSMYQKTLDMSNPDYVQAGDNVGVCFTVELDEGYTFASGVTAYIERDGVTLSHEYKLVGFTDREKRFLWTYTIPTPEGGSYVRSVTESVTAPVAGAEPVWTSENSATATDAGAKSAAILPEPTVKEKFDRAAAHVVKSIEWYETGRDGERKMQQGESFQRGKGYAVWLTVAPVSGKQFHEHTLYNVNTDTAATVTRQSNAEAGAFVVRESSQQALLGYVFSVPDTDVLLGDVNGDGSVTVNDIVKITQYVLGTSHEIDTAAADVNVDGSVTVTDIVYVTYYILYGVFPSQAQAKTFAAEWDMEE